MSRNVVITEIEKTKARHNVALLGAETNGQLSFRFQEVAPGYGTPLHAHDIQSETFHVVSGRFIFQVGDEQVIGTSGFTVHIPEGIPHCFLYEDVGQEEEGRLVSVLTPGVHDGFIQKVPAAQDSGASQKELTALAAENGVQIIGPKLTPIF